MSGDDTGKKWRWAVASWLNRLPNQCWADLVMWALNWHHSENRPWAPSKPIGSMCRRDAAENGSCYCGKLRTPEATP